MLRRLCAAPLLLPALAGTAFAQTADTPAAPSEVQAPPSQQQTGTLGQLDTNGTYTVKGGDTLWDLSQQFLNNPWYWPKIWADNPSVENPHWIYPGKQLVIHRASPGAPAEVSAADDQPVGGDTTAKNQLADFSVGNVNSVGKFAQGTDDVTVGGSIPIGLQPTPSLTHIRISSIVTQHELEDAGKITHSFEEKSMLGEYDRIYIKFPNLADVRLGSTYTIFRTEKEPVVHPITHRKFGYQTRLLGTVKIIGKTHTEALGEIGPVIEDVGRGDHLAANTSLEASLKLTPNERDVTGVVLTAEVDGLQMPGQNHVVFIDKGSADGVKDGNTFTVVETGDGLNNLRLIGESDKDDPDVREDIATLVVYNVTEHAAAALVVKSLREINIGDRVEMRKSPTLVGEGGDTH